MLVDNINVIKPILNFDDEGYFYYIQILQRGKEHPELPSSGRVVKKYYIHSMEYLDSKYDEIKKLCNIFNARAMIRLNRRSYEKVAFKHLSLLSDRLSDKQYDRLYSLYDKAVGKLHSEDNKSWIVDVDEELTVYDLDELKTIINNCQPEGDKIITYIPSLAGLHLITKPFNTQTFNKNSTRFEVDIHKDNPTNLYIP